MRNKNRYKTLFIIICAAVILLSVYAVDSSGTIKKQIVYEEPQETSTEESANVAGETSEYAGVYAEDTTDTDNTDNTDLSQESEEPDSEDLIDFDAEFPYEIKVNRVQNLVIVYGIDYNGSYSVPYKIFVCSTGAEGHETPTGTFSISDKYEWRLMVDGSYAQYATRIYKGIMFHSVPYFSQSKDDLETEEFNKLGSAASLGCIRLAVEDIKWIYDNCPKGTTVMIYDDGDEIMPLDIPDTIKIPMDSPYAGWDPTDPDEDNPWK